ncbi:hypothetical protein ACFY8B_22290 [Streptomyces sp. NPDC012751]|uniref:hypothetical protein n=1 Tax=Streptomyces sp. NPDC012751 TaxID=3364846 RepID=UPI0036C2582C
MAGLLSFLGRFAHRYSARLPVVRPSAICWARARLMPSSAATCAWLMPAARSSWTAPAYAGVSVWPGRATDSWGDALCAPTFAGPSWLSRSPHWYDDGGYLPPGLSLVANGTGSPEAVFTATQWDDIRAARGAGRPITINVESTTVLDGLELKGMGDKRIEFHDGEAARSLNNGRIVI